jgi:hypothetical protein
MENNRLVLFGCAHELCQMCFKMKKRRLVYFTVAAFALVCAGQVFGQASVTTDQSDYPPGSTATINGSGFQPGETVELQELRTDLSENSGPEHALSLVMNDASGNFTTTWYVACEILNVNIKLAKKT